MDSKELTTVGFISAVSKSMMRTADVFSAARRQGSNVDIPEGSRYIVISDTLATAIAVNFRAIAKILGGLDVSTTAEFDMVRGGAQEQVERGRPAQEQGTGSPDAVAGEESDAVL